jgi:hypothetical protein
LQLDENTGFGRQNLKDNISAFYEAVKDETGFIGS